MIEEIGGFFPLELKQTKEYHKNAIKLNTGRNALEYILRAKRYKKVYMPLYNCNAALEPIKKLSAEFQFYEINHEFYPEVRDDLKSNEAILYINYFGLNERIVKILKKKYQNIIIDNAQAFFSKPIKGADVFYSARKFFGVPDGSYLYSEKILDNKLECDKSFDRMAHLLKRLDISAKSAYKLFLKNEDYLCNQPIKRMSKLTGAILKSINYKFVRDRRNENFLFYHENFNHINELKFSTEHINGPMIYPLLITKNSLRSKLISRNIYIPTYWENVIEMANQHSIEFNLAKYLLPLPVDQRYGFKEIKLVIENINFLLKR